MLGHVNNARALEAIEDELVARLPEFGPRRVAIEYRGAIERTDVVELASEVGVTEADGTPTLGVWLLAGGEVRVSAVIETRSGAER